MRTKENSHDFEELIRTKKLNEVKELLQLKFECGELDSDYILYLFKILFAEGDLVKAFELIVRAERMGFAMARVGEMVTVAYRIGEYEKAIEWGFEYETEEVNEKTRVILIVIDALMKQLRLDEAYECIDSLWGKRTMMSKDLRYRFDIKSASVLREMGKGNRLGKCLYQIIHDTGMKDYRIFGDIGQALYTVHYKDSERIHEFSKDVLKKYNAERFLIFGDSHIRSLSRHLCGLLLYTGAATAYGLCNDKSKTKAGILVKKYLNTFSNKKELVIMMFGEIDCITHIGKLAGSDKSVMNEVIGNTVKRYVDFCIELRKKVRDVAIVGPFISGESSTAYGFMDDRIMMLEKFNEILRIRCKNENMCFVSLYNEISLVNDEKVKYSLAKDGRHLWPFPESNDTLTYLFLQRLWQEKSYTGEAGRSEEERIRPRLACLLKNDEKIASIVKINEIDCLELTKHDEIILDFGSYVPLVEIIMSMKVNNNKERFKISLIGDKNVEEVGIEPRKAGSIEVRIRIKHCKFSRYLRFHDVESCERRDGVNIQISEVVARKV